MSEVNPTQLNKRVRFGVRGANVIPTPIDPTLTHQGEAADAYATGQAIGAVLGGLTINGKSHVTGQPKVFVIYAGDIAMSNTPGAQTMVEAIEAANGRVASDIVYKQGEEENLVTIGAALDDIYNTLDSELSDEQIEEILDTVFEGGEE